jgi:hypothetical protein
LFEDQRRHELSQVSNSLSSSIKQLTVATLGIDFKGLSIYGRQPGIQESELINTDLPSPMPHYTPLRRSLPNKMLLQVYEAGLGFGGCQKSE